MSLHPTSREAATGGESPYDLASQQDFAAIACDATVIDAAPAGEPGAVTVRRTEGRPLDPFAPLLDRSDPSSYVQAEHAGPGVRVTVRHGGRKP